MQAQPGRKKLSREEVAELYRDLQKAMSTIRNRQGVDKIVEKLQGPGDPPEEVALRNQLEQRSSRTSSGARAAVAVLLVCGLVKLGFTVVDGLELMSSPEARASVMANAAPDRSILPSERFTKEEVKVLTALDQRRAELEERSRVLDEKGREFEKRERAFVTRIAQMKELTETLQQDRLKGEQRRNGQLDQLANVYGAMAPNEAAALIEQLDLTIALSLLERMPEKRIGQILALMNKEKALAITRMLSGRAEVQ